MDQNNSDEVVFHPNLLSTFVTRIYNSQISQKSGMKKGMPHFFLSAGIGAILFVPGILLTTMMLSIPDIAGINSSVIGLLLAFAGLTLSSVLQLYFLYKETKNTDYIVSSKGVEMRDTYLDKETQTASFDNITDIQLEKTILQRPFGTGNVLINTAGSNSAEIRFEHVKNPEMIQDEISEMVSETSYKQPK